MNTRAVWARDCCGEMWERSVFLLYCAMMSDGCIIEVNTEYNGGFCAYFFQDASEQSVEDCPQRSSQESQCPAVFVSISIFFFLSVSNKYNLIYAIVNVNDNE